MTRHPLDRAAMVLGVVGVVSIGFALTTSSNNNFVLVQGLGLILFPVLGAGAVIGGALGQRSIVLAAGAAYVASALIQLAQFGRPTNWIGGNGSTFALLLSLGIGLLVVGLAPRLAPSTDRQPPT
jgi:hypothetical protein